MPEITVLTPGFLLPGLRSPVCSSPARKGERWTDKAKEDLFRRFLELRNKNMKKGDIIEQLMVELGRGRWAIVKALKGMDDADNVQKTILIE